MRAYVLYTNVQIDKLTILSTLCSDCSICKVNGQRYVKYNKKNEEERADYECLNTSIHSIYNFCINVEWSLCMHADITVLSGYMLRIRIYMFGYLSTFMYTQIFQHNICHLRFYCMFSHQKH